MLRFTRRGSALVAAALVAAAPAAIVAAAPVAAQTTAPVGFDLGASVGLFADYPTDFAGQSCEQDAGGVVIGVARRLTHGLGLEADVAASFGVGERLCAYPSTPAPPDGGLYNRATLGDGVAGQSFVATTLSAVLEPLPAAVIGPRLRLGAGRLWDKRLWIWLWGGGLRFRFGKNAIAADVERWHLGYDLNLELWIYRESGPDELQRVQVLPQRPKPYLYRLGWVRTVG